MARIQRSVNYICAHIYRSAVIVAGRDMDPGKIRILSLDASR
jgi:hypothetical protein